MNKGTVTVPKEVLDSMKKAYLAWGDFLDQFEDFVLASDKDFLSKMRKARKEHKGGKAKPFEL